MDGWSTRSGNVNNVDWLAVSSRKRSNRLAAASNWARSFVLLSVSEEVC